MSTTETTDGNHGMPGKGMYLRLAGMAVLSFISMYVLMYAMVNTWSDVFNHVNQAYMAALMAAPMVMIELVLMSAMYRDRRWNIGIFAACAVVLVVSFLAIRWQVAVNDGQFLRSMIPHHSGAILMCREAAIEDAELRTLCTEIIENQQSEIDQMNAIMERLP
ncbi:MAG: DUF305 domain-containing protein, partial [Chloroflexi bacterium]|nr:DUF305 domain-containing protein [Chloroflexota bacterium]